MEPLLEEEGGSWRIGPPVQPGSFAEVELDAPVIQLGGSCYNRMRMGTDTYLKDGLLFQLGPVERAICTQPEPLSVQRLLSFISLVPAVVELECSRAYLGVLDQGTLERAGF